MKSTKILSKNAGVEIIPGILADNTALFFTNTKTLCLSDLHLGYEEELRAKGVHIPTGEFQYQRALIASLISKYKPVRIILNGDIKHTFGGISRSEWQHVLALFDLILSKCELIIIKGNHDVILEPITKQRNMIMVDHYVLKEVLFVHGDIEPKKEWLTNVKTIVMGHEHPAIALSNGVRTENYKCFLALTWRRKNLIIQPSTFSLTTGIDVLAKNLRSKWLGKIAKANVFVVGESEIFAFGKLNKI